MNLIKMRITAKDYVLLSLFITPVIDLLNGLVGNALPIGIIFRSIIVIANIYLCSKHISSINKKNFYTMCFTIAYMVIQGLFVALVSKNFNLIITINYSMKVLLFLSELCLILTYLGRNTIHNSDIEKFWKFSCWFVPISLIVCKILNLKNYINDSMAGLYSSVNAMSVVLIIHFVLSMLYAQKERRYWITALLSIVSSLLLGTKSPLVYMIFILILIIIFNSKNKLRTIIVITSCFIIAYHILQKHFGDNIEAILTYQNYYIAQISNRNDLLGYLLSGRNLMLKKVWDSFRKNSIELLAITFGVGISNISSGIEMDFFELLFSNGIFISCYLFSLPIRSFFIKINNKMINTFLNIALFCVITFSFLGGHSFTEAISATYISILISYKYSFRRVEV